MATMGQAVDVIAAETLDQDDTAGAIDALRHSVSLDGADAGAFNTLALLLKRTGDAEGAKEAFAKAAALRKAEADEKAKALRDGSARIAKQPAENPAK